MLLVLVFSSFVSVLVELLISFFVSPLLTLVLANENDGLVSRLLLLVSVLLMEKENVGFVVDVVAAKLILANGLLFVVVDVDVCCVLLVLPFFDLFALIISLLFTAGTTVAVFSSMLDAVSFAFDDGASTLTLSSSFSLSNSNLRCRCSSHFFCAFCIRLREALHGDEVVVAAVDGVDIDDILTYYQ